MKTTLRTCPAGHRYYKSSDCPVCPLCEKERKPAAEFLRLLPAPARRALEKEGISNPEKLSAYSDADLLRLHGVGPGTLKKIREILASQNLPLKQ